MTVSVGHVLQVKSKYGGMDGSDIAKLKAMEDENARLKRLLAETMLDNAVLKDLLGMEAASPPPVREQGRP